MIAAYICVVATVVSIVIAVTCFYDWTCRMLREHTKFMYTWPLVVAGVLPLCIIATGFNCWHLQPAPGFTIVKRGCEYSVKYPTTGMVSTMTSYTYHGAVVVSWERYELTPAWDKEWKEVK